MVLPLGKLTILIGAGIVGSVLSQEGRASKVTDFFSGALKIVYKHIHQDSSGGASKFHNDTLLAQVNSLKQELQMLASCKPVTIVTGNVSGGNRIRLPVAIVISGVAGYSYMRWKGWRFTDMMFATRRSLSEACAAVGKQLEQMNCSISTAKRHLSSRIDRVDISLDECAEINVATRDEVSSLRSDLRGFVVDVESVQRAVQTLETKIGRIEGKQDLTNLGVRRLVGFVSMLEEKRNAEGILAPALTSDGHTHEPLLAAASRTISLPSTTQSVGTSASVGTPAPAGTPKECGSISGLKELQDISIANTVESNTSNADTVCRDHRIASSGSSRLGNSRGFAFLSRTCSAAGFLKQPC